MTGEEKRFEGAGAPRRANPRVAFTAAALAAAALALGALGARHGPAAMRGVGDFMRTHLLEAPVLKAPLINAERADQRRRG